MDFLAEAMEGPSKALVVMANAVEIVKVTTEQQNVQSVVTTLILLLMLLILYEKSRVPLKRVYARCCGHRHVNRNLTLDLKLMMCTSIKNNSSNARIHLFDWCHRLGNYRCPESGLKEELLRRQFICGDCVKEYEKLVALRREEEAA